MRGKVYVITIVWSVLSCEFVYGNNQESIVNIESSEQTIQRQLQEYVISLGKCEADAVLYLATSTTESESEIINDQINNCRDVLHKIMRLANEQALLRELDKRLREEDKQCGCG